ncbi:MAG: hypothetical protein RQ745_03035 [Longimicrobiales bacterium]|nr:hypothetical protein [Longimicrobiales bacterium]
MNDTARFALIQRDRESHDPMALARALAAVRETPVQDQVLAAKRAWGIVADDLPESEARALGRALGASGVECAVGPTGALAELPALEAVRTVDALPPAHPILIAVAGLTITAPTTRAEAKGPSGAQKAASAAIMMTTGLPIRIGGRKRPVEKTHDEPSLVFYADLYYANPPRGVRIDASNFDFSCLETRMLYQAQGNLKLLIGDLAGAAPEAWTNHGARVLLEGRPIRTMGYATLDDLEREARWLLTLRGSGA